MLQIQCTSELLGAQQGLYCVQVVAVWTEFLQAACNKEGADQPLRTHAWTTVLLESPSNLQPHTDHLCAIASRKLAPEGAGLHSKCLA